MLLSKVISALNGGGLVVIPTDTIYGIVARAFDKTVVRRLYALRRKTPQKPFVILIDTVTRLREFNIRATPAQKLFLKKVWPGKVSVVLSCHVKKFSYLHLGMNTLAFRLPKGRTLRALLRKTGPLVAPSANPEGGKPAETISEAKKYFGDRVAVYVDAGRILGKPSTLVSLRGGRPEILRKGAMDVTISTASAVAYLKGLR